MIELLLIGGALAVVGLLVIAAAFLLHQRRSGTVRAVLFPRRSGISRPRLRRQRERSEQ
ncbi:MAG: hypothetical protein M3N29_01250 [Chloroflexota bacterium]|nr:hypothetical protein [Chloroflexota bacterium]